jgi:hypothetical protein
VKTAISTLEASEHFFIPALEAKIIFFSIYKGGGEGMLDFSVSEGLAHQCNSITVPKDTPAQPQPTQ